MLTKLVYIAFWASTGNYWGMWHVWSKGKYRIIIINHLCLQRGKQLLQSEIFVSEIWMGLHFFVIVIVYVLFTYLELRSIKHTIFVVKNFSWLSWSTKIIVVKMNTVEPQLSESRLSKPSVIQTLKLCI